MAARRCDLMVVNTPLAAPGEGFGANRVQAAILPAADAQAALIPVDKSALAVALVRRIAQHQAALSGAAT
jgi:hypothetical protein